MKKNTWTPQDYCAEKTAASGSSFALAFRFLPRARREAITAVYAYCREVDDIADECRDPLLAQSKLDWWRGELAALYAGQPSHPVTRALAPAISAYHLPHEDFEALLDGMEMDLRNERYPDFRALGLYCYRVAGVVGQLSARLFGYRDARTLNYAARLGLALQLTNILRDVGEDARRGRIYLPEDERIRFGVSPEDLLAATPNAALRNLLAFQFERAWKTYDEAYALLPAQDRRAQRPGLIMAAIYRRTLEEIRNADFPVLTARVSLPPLRKLWIALSVMAGRQP